MKKKCNISIYLEHITKEYVIHHEKPTLVEKFVKTANGHHDEKFYALNDISLVIHTGEKVGIVGPNGSGKTTLLKIIAGITTPTKGTVHTYGKVTSLIDLDAGFHPDLPGIDNIYLNGILIGMTRKEIDTAIPSIIRFAGIRQFIDAPVYTYSTGMQLRLGFAVAIHSHPDIIVMDEGFLAGDEEFRHKAMAKIASLQKTDITMLVVSQWKEFLQNNCDRIISFSQGNIDADRPSCRK
jgi:ABC-type polysaccharide/polyol phosphate transport system ATPase subunit